MNENNEVRISIKSVILTVLLIVILVGGSGYFFGKNNISKVPTAIITEPKTIIIQDIKDLLNDKNLAFGNKNSKLIFVEFSDPSCPYCQVAAGKNGELNKKIGQQFILKEEGGTYVAPVPEIKKLVDDGKAAFVWIYANGHGNGELGTLAQYCAKEKGKFWEVHDLLMSAKGYDLLNNTVKNDKTQTGVLADFLKNEVDQSEMKACLDSGKYDSKLSEDMAIAQKFGFKGTPSFFVNTTNFGGAYNFTDMQSAVDSANK